MMVRTLTTSAALIPVAAAAAANLDRAHALAQEPVIWVWLGYPFEAATMCAALFGCLAARWWIGAGQQVRKAFRWRLDFPVSAMALASTAGLILMQRPVPFIGLLYGAGAGILGEGIFTLAERNLSRFLAVRLDDTPPEPPHDPAGPSLQSAYAKTADAPVPADMSQHIDRLDHPA